ncbi:MAG: hypothetical protein DBY32_09345 [Phascolarctobacterium sp.]|nr:MAG: hypothetical protein DBY32_09345 [Phascolarctobacterium sp.]
MNVTLKHNGQVLINTNRVVRCGNGLLAYGENNLVNVTFYHPSELSEDDASLIIDCRQMEGGEFMDTTEMDKYGVIEDENVLLDDEKTEIEEELSKGNDSEHK